VTQSSPVSSTAQDRVRLGGRSAWYALILLTIVQAASMLDRQVVTILAADIKADLGLTDAEIGLVYGTFFAIFYALFSIPLGRLADGWSRTRQIALGLFAWSALTALCGFARGFPSLAAARTGVAVGEAAAAPAAYSLIADYFPKSLRATAFAIYGAGVAVGVGASIMLGGVVLDSWNALYPHGGAPLGIKGWQAAFIAAAIPGMVLSLLVVLLKEPPRGLSEGIIQKSDPHPFRTAGVELMALVPPLSFINLARLRVPAGEWVRNIATLAVVIALVAGMTHFVQSLLPPEKLHSYGHFLGISLTSHLVQWATAGFGAYAALSWVQSQRLRDPVSHRVMWTSPTFIAMLVVAAFNLLINYGVTGWGAVFAVQQYHTSVSEVGLKMGMVAVFAGLIGTFLGGWVADLMRRRSPRGRIWVLFASTVPPVPLAWWTFTAATLDGFVLRFLILSLVVCAWLPCLTATLTDLVLPRMRGTATAIMYLGITIVGLGIGPYFVGLVSDVGGNLQHAILWVYIFAPIVWIALCVALRYLERDEATLVDRARAAGEAI